MSLRDKLLKNSTIDLTATMANSKIFQKREAIITSVPMINVALSGDVDGGLYPGMTMIAGPSKHFKSTFGLLMCSSFLKANPEGACLFYDSEFGTPESYVSNFGIDTGSIIHTPITDVEALKQDIMAQLTEIKRGEKVFIFIDSIGNLASKKEIEDALNQKTVADMSRAKQLKSLFRMITPHLALKHIPAVVINHTYKEMALFPRDIVSGGTGAYYSADNIWIVGRQQDKDNKEKELKGYHFIINIEKSRYVKEKSKIPISVSFEGGINRWSGLFDEAVEGGWLKPGKDGAKKVYDLIDRETGEVLQAKLTEESIIDNAEFWKALLVDKGSNSLSEYIKNKYQLDDGPMVQQDGDEE